MLLIQVVSSSMKEIKAIREEYSCWVSFFQLGYHENERKILVLQTENILFSEQND